MYKVFSFVFTFIVIISSAQEKKVLLTLPITDNILETDSVVIVQAKAPKSYGIHEK